MALYLGQEVADNAYADLNPVDDDSSFTVSIPNLKAASYAVMQSSSRKRKHGITESFEQQNDKIGFEVEAPKSRQQSPIGLKIAALEAIEVLLNVVCTFFCKFERKNFLTFLLFLNRSMCYYKFICYHYLQMAELDNFVVILKCKYSY